MGVSTAVPLAGGAVSLFFIVSHLGFIKWAQTAQKMDPQQPRKVSLWVLVID